MGDFPKSFKGMNLSTISKQYVILCSVKSSSCRKDMPESQGTLQAITLFLSTWLTGLLSWVIAGQVQTQGCTGFQACPETGSAWALWPHVQIQCPVSPTDIFQVLPLQVWSQGSSKTLAFCSPCPRVAIS